LNFPDCLSGQRVRIHGPVRFFVYRLYLIQKKRKNPESASYKVSVIPDTEDSDDRETRKNTFAPVHGPASSAGRLHRGAAEKTYYARWKPDEDKIVSLVDAHALTVPGRDRLQR
jgi:hypothetical protein